MTITIQKDTTILPDGTLVLSDEERVAAGVGPEGHALLVTTDQGVLITTRAKLFLSALERIGDGLRANGVTLEELIESGAQIREELVEEYYPRRPE